MAEVTSPSHAAGSSPSGSSASTASPPTPFSELGGSEEMVRDLVRVFYTHMASHERALAKTHQLDEQGRISALTQERFGRFLIEWLGGPARYSPQEGHPRLRMRHGHVAIDDAMADAWLRCMTFALDTKEISGNIRAFLDARFADVAYFLRNRR